MQNTVAVPEVGTADLAQGLHVFLTDFVCLSQAARCVLLYQLTLCGPKGGTVAVNVA